MTDRVFRFSLTGLTFTLSIILGYWLWGGQITSILNRGVNLNWITIIVPVVCSPVIGFIISSTGIGLLTFFCPQKVDFQKPSKEYEQQYLKKIYDQFSDIGSGIVYKNNVYNIENFEMVFINHQLLFRQITDEEIIKFTVRRTDVYWAHINTIFSILFGLLSGYIIKSVFWGLGYSGFSLLKFVFLISIAIYIMLTFWLARKSLKEVNEIEKRYLVTH